MKKAIYFFLLSSLVFTLATAQIEVEADERSETEIGITFVRPITPNPDNLPGGMNSEEHNGNTDNNNEETNNTQDEQHENTTNYSSNQSVSLPFQKVEVTTLLNKKEDHNSKYSIPEDKNFTLGSQVKSYPSTGEKSDHFLKWIGGILLILCVWLWRKKMKEVI